MGHSSYRKILHCLPDFALFAKQNGVKLIRCAPYHLASNGLAKHFVQSLKMAFLASVNSGLSLQCPTQLSLDSTCDHKRVSSIAVLTDRFGPDWTCFDPIGSRRFQPNKLSRRHSMTRGLSTMSSLWANQSWLRTCVLVRTGYRQSLRRGWDLCLTQWRNLRSDTSIFCGN